MREYKRYEEQNLRPERSSSGRPAGLAIAWLLAGIGLGAGAALLLAPASGRELRGSIAHGCRHAIDGIGRGARLLHRKGSNLLSFHRERSEEQKAQQG
jgi:gas vesicle protein